MASRDAGHQFLVQLPHEPDAERKLLEARNAMFEGHNVIADFSKILWTSVYDHPGFCGQQLTKGSLRSLDLARQNSLASNERTNQNMRFGSHPPSPASLPIRRSASERIPINLAVQSSSGGKGAGTNAE